jgi:ribosomal protein S18 acetylase RimI-like enzyme
MENKTQIREKLSQLVYRTAEPGEYILMLELLKEAAIWLRAKGINYWQNWLDPPIGHRRWVEKSFCRGEGYFVFADTELVAGFRLQWEDKMFWGDTPGSAGYVHSLTIKRCYKGYHLGSRILAWIEAQCRQRNREYLRLDYGVGCMYLGEYYKNHGFQPSGEITIHGERLLLMQKKLSNS